MESITTIENLKKVIERVDPTASQDNPTKFVFHNNSKTIRYKMSFYNHITSRSLVFQLEYKYSREVYSILESTFQDEFSEDEGYEDLLVIGIYCGGSFDGRCAVGVDEINKCLKREICDCGLDFIDDGRPICLRCQLFAPLPADLRTCPICLAESHKQTFMKTACCDQDIHKKCHAEWKRRSPHCSFCRQIPITNFMVPLNEVQCP